METRQTRKRSVVKALTYRVIIIILDFVVVYLLTGKPKVAIGFMIISNLYTTLCYFLHERVWSRVQWGMEEAPRRTSTSATDSQSSETRTTPIKIP